jgi:hypothetical protein
MAKESIRARPVWDAEVSTNSTSVVEAAGEANDRRSAFSDNAKKLSPG